MPTDQLTATFSALADPTRRAMLARLSSGDASVQELSKPFKVLERSGLIVRSRKAQWRPCHLEAAPLKEASEWMEHYRRFFEESFDRLEDYLAEIQKKE